MTANSQFGLWFLIDRWHPWPCEKNDLQRERQSRLSHAISICLHCGEAVT
jgi:hypothetical protein